MKNVKSIRRYAFIVIGAALVCISLKMFLMPNHVIDGGITGISMLLSHATGVSIGTFLLLFNLPFFILGYKEIGRTFTLCTLIAVLLISTGSTALAHVDPATSDPMLAAVFGGIFMGVGVGLIIRTGGSTDGVEVLSVVLNNRVPFSIGEILMFFNAFVLLSAGFFFGWNHAMYSIIAYFVGTKTIDVTVNGFDESKQVWIMSDHCEVIGTAIQTRLGRGTTFFYGEGGYTKQDQKILFCVISRLEESKLKSIVRDIDETAFVAISHVSDVHGGRFKKANIH